MIEKKMMYKGVFEMPGTYRIRVGGVVDPKWSEWLGGMQITNREIQNTCITDLVGKVSDQSALAGILNALYEMHLPLLSVEFLGDDE